MSNFNFIRYLDDGEEISVSIKDFLKSINKHVPMEEEEFISILNTGEPHLKENDYNVVLYINPIKQGIWEILIYAYTIVREILVFNGKIESV